MNVMILGNHKTNEDTIRYLSERLAAAGNTVRQSAQRSAETGEDSALIESFKNVDWADMIIAVPKEGLIFAHSITAEIAYARHKGKGVFIYYG